MCAYACVRIVSPFPIITSRLPTVDVPTYFTHATCTYENYISPFQPFQAHWPWLLISLTSAAAPASSSPHTDKTQSPSGQHSSQRNINVINSGSSWRRQCAASRQSCTSRGWPPYASQPPACAAGAAYLTPRPHILARPIEMDRKRCGVFSSSPKKLSEVHRAK